MENCSLFRENFYSNYPTSLDIVEPALINYNYLVKAIFIFILIEIINKRNFLFIIDV